MDFTGTEIPCATEEDISVDSNVMSNYPTIIVDSSRRISNAADSLQQQSESYLSSYEGDSSEKYKQAQEVLSIRMTNLHKQLSMLSLTLNSYVVRTVSINANAGEHAGGSFSKQ